ncbi:MAG: sensor domain-containing protein [Actinomycetota bacterium]
MRWLLQPHVEARTYRVVAYLLVGLVLGVFDFTLLVTGFSLGLGLLVTIIGIPVLVVTFLVARGLATMERRVAISLLDAPMPRRRMEPPEENGLFWNRLRSLASSKRAWSEIAFLLVRLPLSILDFTVIVTVIGLALGGFALPIVVAAGVDSQIGSWTIDTVGEALIYVPVSILFIVVGPRLVIGWSSLSSRVATRLLGRVASDELKREVADILVRRHQADGFEILEDLELRLGRGPFLTPTRVEATLLALESSGRVGVARGAERSVYRLA